MKFFKVLLLSMVAIVLCSVAADAAGVVSFSHVLGMQVSGGISQASGVVGAVIAASALTPALINDLKLKYGHIKILTVVVELGQKQGQTVGVDGVAVAEKVIIPDESYKFAIRRPDKGHIKMFRELSKSEDIDALNESMIKNLVVGGDIDKLDDGLVYVGLVTRLQDFIRPAHTFLETA